jgi:four helix bundle protein
MFTHHKLKVYEKALVLAAGAEGLSASWGRRHAIVEHFRRASESMVLNIAEGARLHSGRDKSRTLDYAIGSSLECAACLDIATIKGRLTPEKSWTEKSRYLEVTRMLIGLRKSWLQNVLSEDPSPYRAESVKPGSSRLFHHESLDVYQTGLELSGFPIRRSLRQSFRQRGWARTRVCRQNVQSPEAGILPAK